MSKPKIFAILIAVMIGLIWYVNAQDIDLDTMRGWLAGAQEWRAENTVLFFALFFVAYVVFVAFSLPVATFMALAAGAIFGFWQGTLIGSFASTIGATLAFLTSRYLMRDWAIAKLGNRAKAINEGMERDGAFYLFTLRLIPLFPFFAVNLLMGLTSIRTFTYYIVSQIGMLAGTAVYVNAGTQLASLQSLSDILSPRLIASFVLLGLLPWIGVLIVNMIRRRKVYKGWDKPKSFDRNLIVIGAGAAGLVSAYIGASVKAKVTLVEAHKMGGDCLNYGCVPSKALIHSARLAHQLRQNEGGAVSGGKPIIDFKKVTAKIFKAIKEIEPHDSPERYENLGVEVLQGYAKMLDPWRVEIKLANGDTQVLTSKSIIIATGATPFVPPIPGIEETGYLTSDTLWDSLATRNAPPKRLVVLGGGPIGCELSQALARLGSEVTQIEMAPLLLLREDIEISEMVTASMQADGINVLTNHRAVKCGVTNGQKWIEAEHEGKIIRTEFDDMLIAVGRKSRLEGFGLEELGIEAERVIEANPYLETKYPNIFVAGDVAGPYQFTHTASHQAWYASVNALFGNLRKFKADYRVIPWATFVDPEVARVGLNETDAKEQGIAYDVTRYDLDDLDRAIIEGETAGFVKVLTAKGKDKILGVTIVGHNAGELIAEYILAMKHNIGLNKMLGTIHIYPTMNEANKYAAGNWKRAQTSPRVMAFLEKFHKWRRS